MTKNDFTTLISIRIDNATLKDINKFCKNHSYLKRSTVINQALKRVFSLHGDIEIYDFLYCKGELKNDDTKD